VDPTAPRPPSYFIFSRVKTTNAAFLAQTLLPPQPPQTKNRVLRLDILRSIYRNTCMGEKGEEMGGKRDGKAVGAEVGILKGYSHEIQFCMKTLNENKSSYSLYALKVFAALLKFFLLL
jgi:hypothetical protein